MYPDTSIAHGCIVSMSKVILLWSKVYFSPPRELQVQTNACHKLMLSSETDFMSYIPGIGLEFGYPRMMNCI